MSIISGTSHSSGVFYDYPIEQSLRFDGSSYLSRTFGTATSQDTMTLSMWVKRSVLATAVGTGHMVLFMANNGNLNTVIKFAANSQLPLNGFSVDWSNHGTSTSYWRGTQSVFRDTSSWYHLVWNFNSSPFKNELYVNGILDTTYANLSGYADPSSTYLNNNSLVHHIGRYSIINNSYFNGYLANIQFIDGQALDPYFFGESKNGVWIPYNAFSTAGSGTATASDGDTATDSYGTNGFHLTFEDATSTTTLGYDYSGNNNHWTLN